MDARPIPQNRHLNLVGSGHVLTHSGSALIWFDVNFYGIEFKRLDLRAWYGTRIFHNITATCAFAGVWAYGRIGASSAVLLNQLNQLN